jgi:hypothetical protein
MERASMGNYSEKDLSFYGRRKVDCTVEQKGNYNIIRWKPADHFLIYGYEIYRSAIHTEEGNLLVLIDNIYGEYADPIPPNDQTPYYYTVYYISYGDLGIKNGDLALTDGKACAEQDALNRIRTQTTDWRSHPELGADLEDLEGEPNTRVNGQKGVDQIFKALTQDGRFSPEDVTVRAIPVSIEEIDFYTIIDTHDGDPIVIKTPLTLQ